MGRRAEVPLNASQRRHVALTLNRLARETRDRLERWDRSDEEVPGHDTVPEALREVLRETERAARRLGIPLTERPTDPRRGLVAWSSAWWSIVLDARPDALRGYGAVDPDAAATLEPVVEELAARLQHLKSLSEAADRDG